MFSLGNQFSEPSKNKVSRDLGPFWQPGVCSVILTRMPKSVLEECRVIWCLWAEGPKRVSLTVQTLFHPGGNSLKQGSHRARDCFGTRGPKTRFALSLNTFWAFWLFGHLCQAGWVATLSCRIWLAFLILEPRSPPAISCHLPPQKHHFAARKCFFLHFPAKVSAFFCRKVPFSAGRPIFLQFNCYRATILVALKPYASNEVKNCLATRCLGNWVRLVCCSSLPSSLDPSLVLAQSLTESRLGSPLTVQKQVQFSPFLCSAGAKQVKISPIFTKNK